MLMNVVELSKEQLKLAKDKANIGKAPDRYTNMLRMTYDTAMYSFVGIRVHGMTNGYGPRKL